MKKLYFILFLFFPFVSSAENCKLADQTDKYTLALSWLPGICKIKNLPECEQAQNYRSFVLHGLWPEKNSCGEKYSFCGQVKKEEKNFCNYPKITMSSATHHLLSYVMPNVRYEGCLERHEWWKHGSCTKYDPEHYYRIATQYTSQFNMSRFVSQYIINNLESTISKEELFKYFDADFGDNAHKALNLQCENGKLTEVKISLSKDFMDGRLELRRILELSNKKSNCGDKIYIAY